MASNSKSQGSRSGSTVDGASGMGVDFAGEREALTEVVAERVLVLAPHQDDELLGCGGLLRQLVGAGARVDVLFLSDGGGGVERPDTATRGRRVPTSQDNVPSSVRRRQEADAVAEFGGWATQHLGVPDGALAANKESLVVGIKDRVAELSCDLILVPSPFELTPDHTAAFAALFEVLTELRPGDELFEACAGCRVLAYSVNQAGSSNLLVDVGEQLEWLQQAMALYESQLALHNYTAAAIGLRRFRTHALGPSIEAAEGYIALQLDDFTTQSLESLIRSLGPVSSIAVEEPVAVSLVVRTYNRPELLREALQSVAENRCLPQEVVVVNDGGGDPRTAGVIEGLPYPIHLVNLPENRGRAAAANAGLEVALGHYVGFLDDDDILFPEHFQVLTSAVSAAGVRIAYSDAAVATYELTGPTEIDGRDGGGWKCVQRGLPYSRDFHRLRLLVDNYIPFHTLLIERSLALEEPFDEELASFEDWDFLIRLSRGQQFHHVRRTTCEYRHFLGSGHHALGVAEDASLSFLEAKAKAMAKHQEELPVQRLAQAVTELRHETVQRELEVADLRVRWQSDRRARAAATVKAAELESRLQLVEDRFHRSHGEVETLRQEDLRLREEIHSKGHTIAFLDSNNERLQEGAEDRDEHLARTYAEIERLMAIIQSMEGTRAWQLHEFLQRRKS